VAKCSGSDEGLVEMKNLFQDVNCLIIIICFLMGIFEVEVEGRGEDF